MDWKYLYCLLSFSVGFLAGFQGIHGRFHKDSLSASKTGYGFAYLLSRGTLPGGIFLFLYTSGLISNYSLLWAIGCGVSSEAILRSKFFIKEDQKEGGSVDLLKGPFDLLQFYQNFILEEAATSLAAARKEFVKTNLPKGIMFLALCDRVVVNLPAYPPDQAATIDIIGAELNRLRDKFTEAAVVADHDHATLDQRYCEQLGYAILNNACKRGFQTLLIDKKHS